MAKKGKLTDFEVDLIVDQIRDLVIRGFRKQDIYKFTKETYDLGPRQTERYLKKARDSFKQADKKKVGQLRSRYRIRLEKMFHDALNIKRDTKLALEIQKELNKLVEGTDTETAPQDITVILRTDSDDE